MVRTMKAMLYKGIGRSCLNYDEMATLLAEIQTGINSRPLAYQADGVNEPSALSPNDLLRGRRTRPTTLRERAEPESLASTKDALVEREKRLARQLELSWRRWHSDYLGELRRFRAVGRASARPPVIGEPVLIHDENRKRVMWPMGIVTDLIPGHDGRIRAVWLRLSNGTVINRPVQRIYPLEAEPVASTASTNASSKNNPVEPLSSGSRGEDEESAEGTDDGPSFNAADNDNSVNRTGQIRRTRYGRAVIPPVRFGI